MKCIRAMSIFMLPSVLFISGCSTQAYLTKDDPGTATIKIYKNNNSTSTNRYIPPSKVDLKYSYNDLSGTLSNNENVCPSTGDVNLLVIPVHTPGSQFNTDEIRNDIEKAFFAKEDEDIGYFSLSEYYYKSSFGKLNFQGVVTDWFDISEHTSIKTNGDITQ